MNLEGALFFIEILKKERKGFDGKKVFNFMTIIENKVVIKGTVYFFY